MKERPILFSAPMVRAILNGTKSQTRRVVKGLTPEIVAAMDAHRGMTLALNDDGYGGLLREDRTGTFAIPLPRCPYGAPGCRLWVRETWCELDREGWSEPNRPRDFLSDRYGSPRRNGVAYRAECGVDSERCREELGYKWSPSIHMPRWASRLTLTITDVRVERLQDINASDAGAEGLVPWSKDGRLTKYGIADPDGMPGSDFDGTWPWHEWRISPVDAYERLWDSINAARGYGWDTNPWVWVVSFERTLPDASGGR